MPVDRFFHVAAQTVSHKHVFGQLVHGIFVAQPGKGVPAVMGRMLFPGCAVKDIQPLQKRIKLSSAERVTVKFF